MTTKMVLKMMIMVMMIMINDDEDHLGRVVGQHVRLLQLQVYQVATVHHWHLSFVVIIVVFVFFIIIVVILIFITSSSS